MDAIGMTQTVVHFSLCLDPVCECTTLFAWTVKKLTPLRSLHGSGVTLICSPHPQSPSPGFHQTFMKVHHSVFGVPDPQWLWAVHCGTHGMDLTTLGLAEMAECWPCHKSGEHQRYLGAVGRLRWAGGQQWGVPKISSVVFVAAALMH